jgi:hypothetical protein
MIRICTGFNHPYLARAEAYLASLRVHEPDRAHCFTVDFTPGQPIGLSSSEVNFRRCLRVSKFMLQNGAFTLFAPSAWSEDDVVAFTDADAVLQRPLDDDEKTVFHTATRDGGVLAGRNRPEGFQPLSHEATCLFPKVKSDEIERRFPGHRDMPCVNTGFVVARLSTWRKLYAEFAVHWNAADATFGHYAVVQWLLCYCIGRYRHNLTDLPLSTHAHGHLGAQPGVTIDSDGIARHEGKTIFFRHAL